jgi:hypothetical protein
MWDLLGATMMETHVQVTLHAAAAERLARETRVPPRRWLDGLKCRWLCGVGLLLVLLGQRLQRFGLPPDGAMEGRVLTERGFEA